MIMNEIKGIFQERIERTKTIVSFRFNPASYIDFLPGQFLQVIFDEANRANKDLNKYLSFSCAPGKDYIEVTKRISNSEFSGRLLDLQQGDNVLFKTSMGNCVFNNVYKKITFLAGGIGVTPVISILEYIVNKGLAVEACLLYSNRNEQDIAFRAELDSWSKEKENIKVVYTVVECELKDKNIYCGMINNEFLLTHVKNWKEQIVFIYGPPKMVDAMTKLCYDIGCSKENLKTEKFIGY